MYSKLNEVPFIKIEQSLSSFYQNSWLPVSLQSRIPVSCPTSLADLSLFTFLQLGTQPRFKMGLLIFEGWAHYSFITFWIHREIKELWSLLIPGLSYLYLFLQKPEDRLHHDPRSRAGLPRMLVPWPHSRHLLGTSALTTPSDLSRVIVVLPSDYPRQGLEDSNPTTHLKRAVNTFLDERTDSGTYESVWLRLLTLFLLNHQLG